MKHGRLKYGLKLGGVMVPKGTHVAILDSNDPEVQAAWSGIKTNQDSKQLAVKFDHVDHPTILHVNEVEVDGNT